MQIRKLLCLLFGIQLIFSSCTLQKRLYRPGFYFDHHSQSIKTNIQRSADEITPVENNFTPVKIASPTQVSPSIVPSKDSIPPKTDSTKVIVISSLVGKIIEKDEKIKYHLFPFFKTEDFGFAYFIQEPDGSIFLIGRMKDGTERKIPYTIQQFQETQMNNFNDQVVAKINHQALINDYDEAKKASKCIGWAYGLTIAGALIFFIYFQIVVSAILMLAGILLDIGGTIKAGGILNAHKGEKNFDGREEARFAFNAGTTYFGLLVLILGGLFFWLLAQAIVA